MDLSRNPITFRRQIAAEVLQNATAQGGGTILVDGLTGMGKTYFLRELAAQARKQDGWTITFVNADRIENGERYSFIERFFAAGITPDWDFETESKKQPLALARSGVRELLHSQNETPRKHFILIDDAQWIDEESTRVLRHMIPRINRRNVVIACAAKTPHTPSSIGQLLVDAAAANPQDQHFAIEPLQEQEILALALERFGMTISRKNAATLREATGGSFLGIESIFSHVTPEEIRSLHRTWEFPIRQGQIENPLLGAFRALDEHAQAIAQVVCLAEHEVPYETLRAAAQELNIPHGIEEVIRADIIRESGFGRSLLPKHELIGAAVRDTVHPTFARKVYRVLADLTDGFRSVRHLFQGAETWTDELLAKVREYVAEAADQRQFTNVIEILRRALHLTNDQDVRQELVTDLALIRIRAKAAHNCLDLLPEIESMPHSILREFLVLMLRVYLVDEPYPEDRVVTVLQTPAQTPDDAALQSFLLFTLIMVLARSEDRMRIADMLPAARDNFRNGPQTAEEITDARLAWMIAPEEYLLLLDCIDIVLWDFSERSADVRNALPVLIRRVEKLPDNGLRIDSLTVLAGVAMGVGETNTAHRLANEAVSMLDRGIAEAWSSATPRIIQAHCLLLLGHYAKAHEALDHFEEMSYDTLDLESRLTGAALRAKLLSITQSDDPEPYIAQAKRLWDFHWEHYGRDLSVMAKLEHARANDQSQEILDITSGSQIHNVSSSLRGYLTYRAHALLELGLLEETRQLIQELTQQRGTSWYEHWGTLDWLQARLAAASGKPKLAKRHFKAALKHQTYPLTWILTNRDYGNFLISQQEYAKAENVLRNALSKLQAIGAKAYIPGVQGLLNITLERNRKSHSEVLSSMTQREHEVAELLAEGLSNQAIASQLLVSQSTVRFHVSNILRKLQLNSRAEVAMALHDKLGAATDNDEALG